MLLIIKLCLVVLGMVTFLTGINVRCFEAITALVSVVLALIHKQLNNTYYILLLCILSF